jgi:hypothetical protein
MTDFIVLSMDSMAAELEYRRSRLAGSATRRPRRTRRAAR